MADQLIDSLLGISREGQQQQSKPVKSQPAAEDGGGFDLNSALDTAVAVSRSPVAEIGTGLKRSVIGELPRRAGQAMKWAGKEGGDGWRGSLHSCDIAKLGSMSDRSAILFTIIETHQWQADSVCGQL